MIPDECQYCGGKLHEGTTEITAKVNNTVIVIKNIPAVKR
jgi:YgiT-type zinc finger domain-containing protein